MGLEKNRKDIFVLPELKESIPLASKFLKSTRVSEVMPDIGFIWFYIVITFQINNDQHCSALGSQPIGSWQAADDRLSRADARQLLSVPSDVPDADAVPWRMRGTAGDSGVTDGNMLTKNDQNIQT